MPSPICHQRDISPAGMQYLRLPPSTWKYFLNLEQRRSAIALFFFRPILHFSIFCSRRWANIPAIVTKALTSALCALPRPRVLPHTTAHSSGTRAHVVRVFLARIQLQRSTRRIVLRAPHVRCEALAPMRSLNISDFANGWLLLHWRARLHLPRRE